MPLTPAEVHNVAFKKPPIGKRGYDEEEVDAFLDVVEVELSRLIEENNDLQNRPAGAGGVTVSTAKGDDAGAAELASAREENQRLHSHVAELESAMSQGQDGAQAQVVSLQQQLSQSQAELADHRRQLEQAQNDLVEARQTATAAPAGGTEAGGMSAEDHHAQAVQMLALAQQTADQHMARSKTEADRLLTEARDSSTSTLDQAKEQASQHLSEAQARAKKLDEDSSARAQKTVGDAEQRAATISAQFEQRKAALERRVEELRVYEREYRTRLRSYLESQLRDLDASGRAEPDAASGQRNETAPAQSN